MPVVALPQDEVLPTVVDSTDPEYDAEGVFSGAAFRFREEPAGLRVGVALESGERFGYRFPGFTPSVRTRVGSAIAFREGGTTLTFKLVNGQVKERIRFASAVPARLRVGLLTQDCGFEQTADGSLLVRSALTQNVVATIPAPTIVDSTGASGPVRYELAPDGTALEIVTDAAWLAAATYPVFIDPTTITGTSVGQWALMDNHSPRVFKLNDASLVALWLDTAGNMKRSRSTDAGATWGAATTVFSGVEFNGAGGVGGFAVTHDRTNDTLYGLYASTATPTKFGFVFKLVWSGSFWTDSSAATSIAGPASLGVTGHYQPSAAWDSINSRLLVGYAYLYDTTGTGQTSSLFNVEAWSSSLVFVTSLASIASRSNANFAGSCGVLVDTQATPVVFVYYGNTTTQVRCKRYTFNGSVFTAAPGTEETTTAFTAVGNVDAFLDNSSQVEFLVRDGAALKHIKRTGTDTWSSITTLRASGVRSTYEYNVSAAAVGNANSDAIVFWSDATSQTNGEIYYIKRTNGAWGSVTLLAGGTNAGWDLPAVIDKLYADTVAYLLYMTGATPNVLVFNSSLTLGGAPSTPTNVIPTGNANTSLTPQCGGRYLNSLTADPLGAYQILVTRQSDSATMWDSGKVAYGGAAITDGQDFATAYAGSALSKGITYLIQVKFWDNWGDLASAYSTAQTFQVNDTPAVTVTSSAAPATSGPTVTWTYQQALGHAQQSYRVLVKDSGDVTTVYDSGSVVSAGVSHAIPAGTLLNNTSYKLHVLATSTDGLTGEGTQTLSVVFTLPAAAALALTADVTNSKMKVSAYPLVPTAGALATAQILRAVAGQSLAAVATVPTNPLALVGPTTHTGFTAYRQCPTLGLARNVVTNGGFIAGSHGWTLHGNASVVVDPTSVTGYALRTIATGAPNLSSQTFPVEAGKAYSFAAQIRSDGVALAYLSPEWFDAAGAVISNATDSTYVSSTAWTESTSINQVAPGNARSVRLRTFNNAAAVVHHTALRVMQQSGAPAAWTAAHQQYVQRGLEIYEAATTCSRTATSRPRSRGRSTRSTTSSRT